MTQRQKGLQFFLKFGCATVGELNHHTGSNYSHSNIIRPLQKAGIVSREKRKLPTTNCFIYRLENIPPDKIDKVKCVLKEE